MNKKLTELQQQDAFIQRHIGPNEQEIQEMLAPLGVDSLSDLMKSTVPDNIQLTTPMDLPDSVTETEALAYLKAMASENVINKSFIGMGYYGTHVPAVIQRNVLENPGWYTAYTPYQPEISQGRLEALLNFQQVVMDLTGMDLANASLLDEATAAAEAMALCKRVGKGTTNTYFVANDVHPQTLDVLKTRATYFGFEVITGNPETDLEKQDVFGVHLQYPGTTGEIKALETIIKTAHKRGALVTVAADLLSLVLLRSPASLGADVVIGSAQRFGVPMGYGGPHAAFFATKDAYRRSTPGRIIGVSVDSSGKQALRMALQTREQHIRREKATSNICTAQALLANMAGFYAVYHGPEGLRTIASRVERLTSVLAEGLKRLGVKLLHDSWFDTLTVKHEQAADVYERALQAGMNLRKLGANQLGMSLDETTTPDDVMALLRVFNKERAAELTIEQLDEDVLRRGISGVPATMRRKSDFLTHPVFNRYHSETDMLRYLKHLENKDFSLTHGMIPLGSCTMKLNATSEMIPISWPEFANIHPFAPKEQTRGYQKLIQELESMLKAVTGYDAISMQPNSGAQGEYAGLLAIRRYHESRGEKRNVCLIPSSAHGTNPASASMMGLKVVVVKCDNDGNIDVTDLKAKAEQYSSSLSSLMITYPSTHGVFESSVTEICKIIHHHGGQVYLDGANMNAQVGVTNPAIIGSDVSHLNLHKTFCIPHGGGGPGMGPIGVKAHLAPFLPGHVTDGDDGNHWAVSAAPFGSASLLPISWAYIKMMGKNGLTKATQVAILSANYIAYRLDGHFPVLYRGRNNRVAHECIIDVRDIKEETGVTEEDIAKRLMDYGFHAPTMSFPVPGTLMIEPTESESKRELDRFCDALISIREEIRMIAMNETALADSPLRNAPHTLSDVTADTWDKPYSRAKAAYPSPEVKQAKFWPASNRIDNVFGDRNFMCSCPPIQDYEDEPQELLTIG